MTYRLAILIFPQTSVRRDLHVLRPCTETYFPFSISFGRSLWNVFQNDRFLPRPNFSDFVLIGWSRVSIFIIWELQDAPHRTVPRASSEVWAATLTESSPAAPFERTQPTALKRLFVRVVSPRQPCVALKDVFTCYHTVSRSCKYDNLFNMQNVYFTEGPQTNWANIYRERRPKKLAFFPMRCCSLIHLLFSWAKFWQGNSCTWSLEDIVAFVEIIFNSWMMFWSFVLF